LAFGSLRHIQRCLHGALRLPGASRAWQRNFR